MSKVIKNENVWEQVLWFLDKKDNHIDELEEYFWGVGKDGSIKLGLTYYLEQALLKNKHITELEVPLKKNDSNINYDIVNLVKENDGITWYLNGEIVSKEELMDKWESKDIITFEKNLAALFEKMHIERNSTLEQFTESQNYLKKELNTNITKCHGI